MKKPKKSDPQEVITGIIKAKGGYELSLVGTAEIKRKALLEAANSCEVITDQESLQRVVIARQDITAWLKEVEAARVTLKKPILQLGREIDRLANEHIASLVATNEALGKMADTFVIEQKQLLAEEQKRKDEEIEFQKQVEEEAKFEAELARKAALGTEATAEDRQHAEDAEADAKLASMRTEAAMRQPVITTPTRVAGMRVTERVAWKITDALKLYAQKPDWFELVPRKAVINSCVSITTKLEGIEVWEETKTGVRL